MDREKVISQVEEEIRLGKHWDESDRTIDMGLLEKVLLLLKAQEPKFVSDIAEAIIGCKPKVKVGHCPSCGVLRRWKHVKAVKWSEKASNNCTSNWYEVISIETEVIE